MASSHWRIATALSVLVHAGCAPAESDTPSGTDSVEVAPPADAPAVEADVAPAPACNLVRSLTETWSADHGWLATGLVSPGTSGTLSLTASPEPRATAWLAAGDPTRWELSVTVASVALPAGASAFVGVGSASGELQGGTGVRFTRDVTGGVHLSLVTPGASTAFGVVGGEVPQLVLRQEDGQVTLTAEGLATVSAPGAGAAGALVLAALGEGAALVMGTLTFDRCAPAACADSECGSGPVCERHFCNPLAGCGLLWTEAPCDDGDPCTAEDACVIGACVGAALTDCDDGVGCTVDACDAASGCTHTGVDGLCDDGDLCTGPEACSEAAGCLPGVPPDCGDGNACNGVETCHALLGCLAGVPLGCGDGNPCNGQETCDPALGCVAGPPPTCDDGNPCNGQEVCDLALGCVTGTPLACSDGDPCNGQESCDPAQGCQPGTPLACADSNACNGVEVCVPELGCGPGTPLECNDKNPCNGFEACVPAIGCVSGQPLLCDDGLPCNGQEGCSPSLGCTPGAPLPGCCTAHDQCEDGNVCNGVATCDEGTGTCVVPAIAGCGDGNACNGQEVCVPDLGCVAGSPLECGDGDLCNGLESCDGAKGCVAGTPLACDDGLPCTGEETCQPGSGCHAGTPPAGCCLGDLDCNDADLCNGTGHCETGTGTCELTPSPACDDANPCNGVEACVPSAGCVVGPGLVCDDQNPCNGAEVCNATLGCIPGTPPICNDGNPCNGQEQCDAAVGCLPGTPLACADGDVCNGLEQCSPWLGCVPGVPLVCNDGNACNGTEACSKTAGCQPGTAPECGDGDLCNGQEGCHPTLGCVAGTPLSCGDGNPCNGEEGCVASMGCVPGKAPSCDDGNGCNGAESCDPLKGCVPGAPPTCADGNACNGDEACDPSKGCVAGVPPKCDDGNACNGAESCDALKGCVAGAAPVCSDGNACNGEETCDGAKGCVGGAAPKCDDGNACNGAEACDSTKGCTQGTPPACGDGNACNGLETCEAQKGCVAGAPPKCDDGNACNGAESCDTAKGCVPGTPPACSDGNACNGEETCEGAKGCVGGAAPKCDDGNACNGAESCDTAKGCVPGAPAACDDKNPCNGQESCHADTGCAAGTPPTCLDGNPCNGQESCDPASGCVGGSPPTCSDGDPCTDDACDPAAGCTHVANTSACDDGDACTSGDACAQGACAGTPYVCADGRPCTDDVCVGDGTCLHPAASGWCDIAGKCVAAGAPDPVLACHGCKPEVTATAYVPDDTQTCGPLPAATAATCKAGACVPAGCLTGYGDCVGDVAGCETQTASDPVHCGDCQTKCLTTQVCSTGKCKAACDAGLTACGKSCVQTATNPAHCGKCNAPCLLPNAEIVGCVSGQCLVSTCSAGYADANGVAADGCECTIQMGGLELCNGKDDDCDGLIDDAPPSVVGGDLQNCGACGKVCPPGPASHLATCTQGQCGLDACPSGHWNIDGKAQNGCEYACVAVAGYVEACNSADDDCDGVTDEGFDLVTDAANCGVCGNDCALLPNVAKARCAFASCAVDACIEGWKDADGLAGNGCEAVPNVIWVDDSNAADTAQTGSQAHPWSTIAKGLTAASPGDEVRVKAGTYAEAVTVNKAGVLLRGEGSAVVTVATPALGIGIRVTAGDVGVEGLTVKGGKVGIRWDGAAGAPIVAGHLESVVVQDVVATTDTSETAYGVDLRYVDGFSVSGLKVTKVTGASWVAYSNGSTKAEAGGAGIGVYVLGSHDGTLGALTIATIAGGKGKTVTSSAPYTYGSGGPGGGAQGLVLDASTGFDVATVAISGVSGGTGGNGDNTGGGGGQPIGVTLRSGATGNTFSGLTIASLSGGGGGVSLEVAGGAGGNGAGVGMSIWGDSLANTVGLDSKINGSPLLYVYGAKDLELKGYTLGTTTMPTNFGMVAVFNSSGVVVRDCTVLGAPADPGETVGTGTGATGGGIVGVRMTGCGGCAVRNNLVTALTAAAGGAGAYGGTGGSSYGIYVTGSPGVLVEGNTVSLIKGGIGGVGQTSCNLAGVSGYGGNAVGLYVATSQGALVDGNEVRAITSGAPGAAFGGDGCAAKDIGAGGTAFGAHFGSCTSCLLSHHRSINIKGAVGYGNNPGYAYGVSVQGSPLAQLSHLTVRDVGTHNGTSTAAGQYGVLVYADQGTPVVLRNSIVASVLGTCVQGATGIPTGTLSVDHSDLFACDVAVANATQNATCIAVDPQFVNAATSDLHVKATSPCIDTASPDAPYCLEPAPNGCRADMGAYGNTAGGTPKTGATDCPCVP